MQTQNELKEILLELYNEASADGKYDRCVPLNVVIDHYANKILALGKPEPLAKNKHTEDFLEDLEILVTLNEDDFDRGKGKFIVWEFLKNYRDASSR